MKKAWNAERSFLIRALNSGGRFFVGADTVLSEEKLIGTACRQTHLDNFGNESFREPLRLLIESLRAEARLNFMGRLAARQDLLRLLINRLLIEEDRRQNPGIADEEIRRPLIITGMPRTGTTFLHNLLALDETNRVPLTWETMYPSPPPEAATYLTDRRVGLVEKQIRWFHRMLKGFNRIHPVAATLPEECLVIFSHSFLSYQFETTHRLPSYLEWLDSTDLRPAYDMHRRVLQHLQWRCRRERWVLKAPAHMFDFNALFSEYPDACIVMTHRNPLEVTASNASLTATLRSAFSDNIDPHEVGQECSRRWADALRRAILFRDTGGAPRERFLDLYYTDLITDPVGTVRKVYDRFAIPVPEWMDEKVRGFLAGNKKDRFGKHNYSMEEFGLQPEGVGKEYAAYIERFHL